MKQLNFTRSLPLYSPLPSEAKILVLFEATLAGYRDVLKWRETLRHETLIYRVVIPYSDEGPDVGDYLVSHSTQPVKGKATDFSAEHVFATALMITEGETKPWPYASLNRWMDIELGYKHLFSCLVLRDAVSGVSVLQQFMMNNTDGRDPEVVRAMCSAQYKIPLAETRRQWNELFRGSCPPFLPRVMINGPFPFGIEAVKAGLVQAVNTGQHPDWNSMSPVSEGIDFSVENKRWRSHGGRNLKGEITQWPYGVSDDDIPRLVVVSGPHEPRRFEFPEEIEMEIHWDPVFLQGQFTPSEYMVFWLKETLLQLAKERGQLEDEKESAERKRRFVRTVWVGAKGEGPDGHLFRLFTDESLSAKRRRIALEYDGDESLLQLPIRLLEPEFSFGEESEVPESARDLLLLKLQ